MKFRLTGLSIGAVALSIALFLISRQPILSGVLNFLHRSNVWEKRGNTIAMLLVVYGFLFFAVSVFSSINSLKFSTLLSQGIESLKNAPLALKRLSASFIDYHAGLGPAAIWLFLALAIGVAVRSYFLPQPMRGDEAFTFLNYVNQDFLSLFNYAAINNHVLNTLFIKLCTFIWGASPASIRFPDFLAGIAAIAFVFYFARSLNQDKNAGAFAALGTAVFPYLILFSTNARAYAVIGIFTLAIAICAFRYVGNPSKPVVVLLAFLSALGMLTIPIMILPAAGIFCWAVCLLSINKVPLKAIVYQFAIPYGVWSGIFTFILYTPVILVSNGIEPIVANKFVKPFGWNEFFTLILPKTQNAFDQLIRDVPLIALLAIFLLFIVGICLSIRNRNWGMFLIIPSFFLAAVLVMLFQRQIPYDRTWVFIIPFVLLVADFGVSFGLERIPVRFQMLTNTILVLAGVCFAVSLMSRNIIGRYPDTSGFPEAPVAVQYLKPFLKEEDNVHVTATADWSVNFYFWYYGIPRPLTHQDGDASRTFFIVKKSRSTIQDMTNRPVIKLLEIDDLALYQQVKR